MITEGNASRQGELFALYYEGRERWRAQRIKPGYDESNLLFEFRHGQVGC